MDDFDLEIQQGFLDEAKDLLTNVEQCFLNLEKSKDDPSIIENIFRLAHNLKGSAGAVGFTHLAGFAHHLESFLLKIKNKEIAVDPGVVNLLLACNDHLCGTVESLRADPKSNLDGSDLEAQLKAYIEGRVISAPSATVSDADVVATAEVEEIKAETSVESESSVEPLLYAGPERRAPPVKAPTAADENIRVSLSKIDELLNNVGELVIFQAVLNQQSLQAGTQIPPLMFKTLSAMAKIVKETQSISMGLRMLPIKQTFQKMQRIVRDTSQALGKNVELHLIGEETEIDKTVLEQLGDPLVHMIRNAVDHGLEDTEERKTAGKPPVGNVYLSAFHKADRVVIEIREDGRGLNPEKLVARAKAKGILAQDATLTPAQAYQLIFAPGFSTKELVTDVSGRGVGMDVVKTNITQLQGQVEIETVLGKGTCFSISLPLTLAIVDGIVIRLGEERYVIPLSQVNEFFRPKEKDVNFVREREELLTVRDETIQAFRLSNLILRKPDKAVPASDLTALIARDSQGRGTAVLVDEILSQQQIVIKPLGADLKGKRGFLGYAILGDGKPSLILDLHELTQAVRKVNNSASTKAAA